MAEAACNDNSVPQGEAIEREASRWLVRLEDEPDDLSQQEAFHVWLTADIRHARAWQETLDVAGVIARARSYPLVSPRRSGGRQWALPRLYRGWRTWGGMTAAATAACAVWFMLPNVFVDLRADRMTGTAEIATIKLADGSEVTLAPSSAISVSIRDGERDARLLRGEAYFDVVHDASRPFRVFAGESQTRVLGTAFDVALRDRQAAIAVNRGAVEVSLPDRAATFRERVPAGRSLNLDWQGTVTRDPIRPDRVAIWRSGQVIVDDKPIGDVIAALRPWFSGYIVARGAGIETRRVTGLYDLRDPDAALEALAKAHRIDVRRFSPWLRIVTVR